VTAGSVKENQGREPEHKETKRDDCGRLGHHNRYTVSYLCKVHGVKY